jgi:hypothetical protein
MASEDFPGERQGLVIFLRELQPRLAQLAGEDSLLHHAVQRSLRSGELGHLRHARRLLHHLPREQRQGLAAATLARGAASTPPRHELLASYGRRPPVGFVSFELAVGSGEGKDNDTTVGLTHELLPHSDLRVLVSPGTLPQTAAEGLRRIAQMIERDRRLLSRRHWDRNPTADSVDGNAESNGAR